MAEKWYKEENLVRVRFATGYTGWAVDLKDGTCRLANSPLLGEAHLEHGDRVDLFYTLDENELPFIGYRRYEADDMLPMTNLGYPDPTIDNAENFEESEETH